jgi:Alpha amylase, C-terminal all-beta domain
LIAAAAAGIEHVFITKIAHFHRQPHGCERPRRHGEVFHIQRWVPGVGEDLVIVASFANRTWFGYQIGFPRGGRWLEVFNSEAYDTYFPQGNRGEAQAHGGADAWAGGFGFSDDSRQLAIGVSSGMSKKGPKRHEGRKGH